MWPQAYSDFLWLIFWILVSPTDGQTVLAVLEPNITNDDLVDINMTCQYNLDSIGETLNFLQWKDGEGVAMYTYVPSGTDEPSKEYEDRITPKHRDNNYQNMIFHNVTWCEAQIFTCQAYWTGGGHDFKTPSISGVMENPTIVRVEVDGDPFGKEVHISCNSSWNQNFTLTLTMDGSDVGSSYAEYVEETNCTHHAVLYYNETLPPADYSFTCTADYDGTEMSSSKEVTVRDDTSTTEEPTTVTTDDHTGGEIDDQCEGLCGGEIAGIVIGSGAFLAIVGLLIWYCYKKRGNKALEPEKNKRDENKKNPKNNQVGDSQEDLGQDKRNKGDVNYHENPSYSSQ